MAEIARPFLVETIRAGECPAGTLFYVEAQTDGHYLGLWTSPAGTRVIKIAKDDTL